MNIEQKVYMALAYKGLSKAELARRVGQTPQNFSKKLKRETLTNDELSKIAEVLGGNYVFGFEFPDGTKI